MMKSVYSYGLDGQLRSAAAADGAVSEFLWDGLALMRRNGVDYLNEPHPNGGSPVLASDGRAFFNDILGTSQGTLDGREYRAASLTVFGDGADGVFFTGKPKVDDALGYAFLFRNYRSDHGKWLIADPMGYPDGWNNLAYCNNFIVNSIDIQGLTIYYFVAPAAVGIFGHAAAIYDLGNGNVRIIDFGGCTDAAGEGMQFSSVNEAYNRLQNDRPEDEKFGTSALTYETTDADTLIAFDTTKRSISNGYSSLGNNCSQVIADGINAVGGYLSRDIIPNNVIYDTAQMYATPFVNFKYGYSFFEFVE